MKRGKIIVVITLLFVMGTVTGLYAKDPTKKTLVMVASPQGKIIWDKYVPEYRKRTGIKIDITVIPRAEFDAFLKSSLAARKRQLDIIAFEPQFILDYYTEGILADLTNALKNPKFRNIKEDRFKDGALDFKRMPGRRTYAIPLNLYTTFYLYNKKIFNKYNIPVPKKMEDFLELKRKLEGTNIYPLAYPGKDIFWNPFYFYTLLPMVTANNANELTKATVRGDIKWTAPFYIRAMKILKWEMDEGIMVKESLGLNYDTLASLFLSGKIATVYQGGWFYTEQIKLYAPPDFEVGVYLPPVISPGKSQVLGCCDVLVGVNAKTENYEESLKFLDFLLSDEVSEFISDYYISSVKGYEPNDPILTEVLSLIEDNGVPIGHIIDHEWEPEITEEFKSQIQSLLLGRVSPEGALEAVQRVQDELIRKGEDYGEIFGKTYSERNILGE
jgi:raffinose/stachyose/melibiose transport system substrate-binding protein